MIDINTYRSRIGLFNPKSSNKKYLYKSQYYKKSSWNESHAGRNVMLLMKNIIKMAFIFGLLMQYETDRYLIYSSDGVSGVASVQSENYRIANHHHNTTPPHHHDML